MELKLDAHGKPIGQDPFRQHPRREHAMDGRYMDGGGAACQVVPLDHIVREFVVLPILHDEFHFVMRTEAIEIGPVIPVGFAAAGAFHVEDGDDRRGHPSRTAMPARFEQYRTSLIEQHLHQWIDVFLQERLPASHLDERAVEAFNFGTDLVQAALLSLVKGVRRVTPGTAEIAGREPDEDARPACVARLTLHRVENLVNSQHG